MGSIEKMKFYGKKKYEKKKILWKENIEKMNFYCSAVIILLYGEGGYQKFLDYFIICILKLKK